MTTTGVNAATLPAVSASSAANNPLANTDVFLQLLVAQLKYQDPLSPADGTQFVTQLAQFSTLEQTTHGTSDLDAIRQELSVNPNSPLTSATPASNQTAAGSPATKTPATASN